MARPTRPAAVVRANARHYTYNTRLIRQTLPYSIQEIADLYGLHPNAIRQWLKAGLPVIGDARPFLIHGSDLIAFLGARQTKRKRPCGAGEMYCCRCRAPRRPLPESVTSERQNSRLFLIRGTCELCGAKMRRAAACAHIDNFTQRSPWEPAALLLTDTPDPVVLCESAVGDRK